MGLHVFPFPFVNERNGAFFGVCPGVSFNGGEKAHEGQPHHERQHQPGDEHSPEQRVVELEVHVKHYDDGELDG